MYFSNFDISTSSKIGEEQSAEDAEDGPPELLVGDVIPTCLIQI